tara:strand:+ start:2068 stop:2196 length:129 start_codon:yes stop_codon:yes gene_type:complete
MIGILEMVLILIAAIIAFNGKEKTKMINKIGKIISEIRKMKV